MIYAALVSRLFGRVPSTVTLANLAESNSPHAIALEAARAQLAEFGDAPRVIAQVGHGFVSVGQTHAILMDGSVVEVARLQEADQEAKEPLFPVTVRDVTPSEKQFVRTHIAHGRTTYKFGKFRPGQRVKWNGETWIVYDGRWLGPSKFGLLLISTDYERMASNVLPADIGSSEANEATESLDEAIQDGDNVRIHYKTPRGPIELAFQGKVGTVSGIEKDGRTKMFRVRFRPPVDVPGIGHVDSDLWAAEFLKKAYGESRVSEARTSRTLLSMKHGKDTWALVASGPQFLVSRNGEEWDYEDGEISDGTETHRLPTHIAQKFDKIIAGERAERGYTRTNEAVSFSRKKFGGWSVRANRGVIWLDDENKKVSYYLSKKHGDFMAHREDAPSGAAGRLLSDMDLPADVTNFLATLDQIKGDRQHDESLDEAKASDQWAFWADWTPHERIVFNATVTLKPGYGGDKDFRFNEAARKTGITRDQWDAAAASLKSRGVFNAAGAVKPDIKKRYYDERQGMSPSVSQGSSSMSAWENVDERTAGANLAGWRLASSVSGVTVRSPGGETFHVVLDGDDFAVTDGAGKELSLSKLPGYVIRAIEKMLGVTAESLDEADQLPKSPHKGKPWDDVVAMGKGGYIVKIWRGQRTKWAYSTTNPQGGGFSTTVETQDVMAVLAKALNINDNPARVWVVVGARKPTDPFDPFEVATAFWFNTEKNLPESVDEARTTQSWQVWPKGEVASQSNPNYFIVYAKSQKEAIAKAKQDNPEVDSKTWNIEPSFRESMDEADTDRVAAETKTGDLGIESLGNEVRVWLFLTDTKGKLIARSSTFMGTRVLNWDVPEYAPESQKARGKELGMTHVVPSSEAKDFTVARLWGGKRAGGQAEAVLKRHLGHLIGSGTQVHAFYAGHGFSGTSGFGRVGHRTYFANPDLVIPATPAESFADDLLTIDEGLPDQKTLMTRPMVRDRYQITAAEWKTVHRDFRGGSTRDDTASVMMQWDGKTSLVPVAVVKKLQEDDQIDEAKGGKLVAFLDMGEWQNPQYRAVMDFGEHGIATYSVFGDTFGKPGADKIAPGVEMGRPKGGEDKTAWFRGLSRKGDEWARKVTRELANASRHNRSYTEDESSLDEAKIGSTLSLFVKLEKTVLKKTEGMPGTAPIYGQLLDMLAKVRAAIRGHETKTGDDAVRAFVPAATAAGFMGTFGAPLTQLLKHPLVVRDPYGGMLSIRESVDESTTAAKKLAAMRAGKVVTVGDGLLGEIEGLVDSGEHLRSLPNPKQVGTKDTYVAWIGPSRSRAPVADESIDEMAKLSAGGRSELLRVSKEVTTPDDESIDWRRTSRVWTSDGKVLEKSDVNFKAWGEGKARKHSYGWKVVGTIKADLLSDPIKLSAALTSTRAKLEAAGWSVETFAPPQ